MTRRGPRPNVAVLAAGRGWRLVLVEPETRVLPGWRRYTPTDDATRLLLSPASPVRATLLAMFGGAGGMLASLTNGFAALRAAGYGRRVLALEVRDASADVRRVRVRRP